MAFDCAGITAELGPAADDSPQGTSETRAVERVAAPEKMAGWMTAILESLTEAILVVDSHGDVVLRNRASRRMSETELGRAESPWESAGLSTWHLDGSPVESSDHPARRLLSGLPVHNQEYIAERRDGSRFRVLVNGATIQENGETSLAVVMYRDVSETRRLEETKADYVRALSHDLRDPLTILMVQAQMLWQALEGRGLARESRLASDIQRTARRMNLMLDDLADSLRLESGHFALRKGHVDLCALLREVAARAELLGQSKIEVFVPKTGRLIEADALRIERCVLNLLSNAMKYAPAGSPVVVNLRFDEERAYVAVEDRGPGIEPDDLPHIFERFYRGKTAAGSDGLGLGLYICELIAGAHGGSIAVENRPGRGSIFTLALPAR